MVGVKMILNKYLRFLHEASGRKCRAATQRYRERLAQMQRLNIDARAACDKIKNNPLATPGGYKECMDGVRMRVGVAKGRARNERLRMQKYCKKSVAAQLSGTKNAPEISPDED